jgi:hypothetical protein
VSNRSKATCLIDDLVGAGRQRRRYFEAERFRGLEIDHELELRRPHDWEVGGLFTFENRSGWFHSLPTRRLQRTHATRRLPAPVERHEGDKPFAPAENERIGCDNKATRTRMGNGRKGGLEVDFAAGVQDMKLHPERARRLPKLPSLIPGIRVHRVYKGSKRGGLGNELAEQPQSLSLQFGGEEASRP